MAERHICPVCNSQGQTVTIHDDLYICGEDDCGVSWNPQRDNPEPFYPQDYAIGYCPRCTKHAGEPGTQYDPTRFECPHCGYDWFDSRLDGKSLALSLGYASGVDDYPDEPRRYELYT